MRFKDLLFEGNLGNIKDDCSYFTDKSQEVMTSDFYLGRASKNEYKRTAFRDQRGVEGEGDTAAAGLEVQLVSQLS